METEPEMYKRFVEGLEEYGLNIDVVTKTWMYCGSNKPYCQVFECFYPDCERPEFEQHCICKQRIMTNCYITDGQGSILVIGSDCLKNFLKINTGKRCSHCKTIHRNRKDNFCNNCREIPNCNGCEKKGSVYCQECRTKDEERIKQAKQLCICGEKKDEISVCCYKCVIRKAEQQILRDKVNAVSNARLEEQRKKRQMCICGKKKREEYPRCYSCQQERNKRYESIK
jgi:hypothetical protein